MDVVRGIAVLVMMQWHAADAWIATGRDGRAFDAANVIGGLAAPFFLALAGTSLVLAMPQRPDRAWVGGVALRALRVVLAGYGLNLFAWAVDRGAFGDLGNWPAIALGAAGLGLLAWACTGGAPKRRVQAAVGGGILVVAMVALLPGTSRGGLELMQRVDVLHAIGAALVVVALVLGAMGALPPRPRTAALLLVAVTVASTSVIAIGAPQAVLPASIAGWIARATPYPGPTPAAFPLLPWCGYAFLGAAAGSALRGAEPGAGTYALPGIRRPLLLLVGALAVVTLLFDRGPFAAHVLSHAGWARSLFRLGMNGSLMVAFACLTALLPGAAAAAIEIVESLGRHSLVVYAVHLELVFGVAGAPLRRTLGWGGWMICLMGLTAAMIALTLLLDRRRTSRTARVRAP